MAGEQSTPPPAHSTEAQPPTTKPEPFDDNSFLDSSKPTTDQPSNSSVSRAPTSRLFNRGTTATEREDGEVVENGDGEEEVVIVDDDDDPNWETGSNTEDNTDDNENDVDDDDSDSEDEDGDHGDHDYWCHQCQREITAILDTGTPTCPRCHGDFVEEIEDIDDPRDFIHEEGDDAGIDFFLSGAAPPHAHGAPHTDAADPNDPESVPGTELGNLVQMWLNQILATDGPGGRRGGEGVHGEVVGVGADSAAGTEEEGGANGDGIDDAVRREHRRRADERVRAQQGGNEEEAGAEGGNAGTGDEADAEDAADGDASASARTGSTRRNRPHGRGSRRSPGVRVGADGVPVINLADFLQFAFTQSGQDAAANGGRNPLMSLFNMVGNPGDYVFGSNGLDDVITRLMEQHAQRTQPPSASEETINSLPTLKVALSELGEHTECPVCQDDYVEGEDITKMPCKHVFHPACIREWLKVNGTCPVCRYSLVGSKEEKTAGGATSASGTSGSGSNGASGSAVGGAAGGPTNSAPPTARAPTPGFEFDVEVD
ncbi:hypothetical protein HK097_004458 [Rhizophlyctis rosea]|uniref:RING-type E3 ubiquitin transferase n=1 Tax=Rhizophlyctis rosea TaxID=64517 RepID=A0AAD5SFG7_9FUNG|nr:hypothetical protein HK097_004458 [Rhizophlyctis rosea]